METIEYIKKIAEKYQLTGWDAYIQQLQRFLTIKYIDISIFGQFKAGKSSFINSFIGKNILPTNVIPTTSIITIIQYGEKEKAYIHFLDNSIEEININQLEEYTSELKNPQNVKNVNFAIIYLPQLKPFEQIRIIDTPGIGSIFKNNTSTTESWTPETMIAVVCISSERPLAEQDISLIKTLNEYSYKVVCLLTKTDYFNEIQINDILHFISQTLIRIFNKEIPIFPYSIFRKTEYFNLQIINEIITPIIHQYNFTIEAVCKQKQRYIIQKTINYFELAYQASLKNEEQQKLLKQKILDEYTTQAHITYELTIISKDLKSNVRHTLNQIFESYYKPTIAKIEQKFDIEFVSWKGNLHQLTNKFKFWLKTELTIQLQDIQQKEQIKIEKIIQESAQRLSLYSKHLNNRLSDNVEKILGIKLSALEWSPGIPPIKQPDVSVYRVFDSHIELLWFVFPSIIFKKFFYSHFKKQIHREVEKNIQRLISDLSEIIIHQIDMCKNQTLQYILNEIKLIDNALSHCENKSEEYKNVLNELQRIALI
ncbi:MAG: dynamin family protein [Bacteroidales bacterium]|nr:dynamin family protein [Bacteroidales bacterium]